MQTRTYALSPYTLVLRDKIIQTKESGIRDRPLVLEQYMNDIYHHFLQILTSSMQDSGLKNEHKLPLLLEELIKTKKLLEENN